MTNGPGGDPHAPYALVVRRSAKRALAEQLPAEVAFAVTDLITGPLLVNPQRVGKRLDPPLDDQHAARVGGYRVLYEIAEGPRRVTVRSIRHRRDAYRL